MQLASSGKALNHSELASTAHAKYAEAQRTGPIRAGHAHLLSWHSAGILLSISVSTALRDGQYQKSSFARAPTQAHIRSDVPAALWMLLEDASRTDLAMERSSCCSFESLGLEPLDSESQQFIR